MNFQESLTLLFKNIYEPFMNTLMIVHERLYFFVYELFMNVHEQFMIISPGKPQIYYLQNF